MLSVFSSGGNNGPFARQFPFHNNNLGQAIDEVPMERQESGSAFLDIKRMVPKSLQKSHYQNHLGCFSGHGHVVCLEGEEC